MWPVRVVDESQVGDLARGPGVGPLLARLLGLRGVRDPDEVQRWLKPALKHLHPPQLLPDFEPARERIERAIHGREQMLLWGHDDLDGMTAVAVLKLSLEALRGRVVCHIPARGKDKHGLHVGTALEYAARGAGLIITADCGITNLAEIKELEGRGIDVIVTDHHEVTEGLPVAVANVNPKRDDSRYPYRGLAGVGVALKLAMGLAESSLGLSVPEFVSVLGDTVALAVLGTIADRVPLTGENRTLVAVGMERLERTRLAAVRVVLKRLRLAGKLTPLKLLPRLLPLFAAADGHEGVGRLLDPDEDAGGEWLDRLEQRAEEWNDEAAHSWELAQRVAQVGDGLVVARSRDLSLRTLGHCAARLKREYHLPAVVIGWRGDAWVAECRGVAGMSLTDLLAAHRDYFVDYGGHRMAAGFTVTDERVEDFVRSAEAYAHRHLAGRLEEPVALEADAELRLVDFDPGLAVLAPFGAGNPEPLFVSEPVRLHPAGDRLVPDCREDLRLRVTDRGVEPGSGDVVLLYSMDDEGNLVVRDSRPA